MRSFLKRVLFPTRFDACCLVVVAHWLMVLVTITVFPVLNSQYLNSWLLPIDWLAAATWIGITVSFCWRANSKSRVLLLLCSSVASLVFVHAWYWLNPHITDASKTWPVEIMYGFLHLDRSVVHEIWHVLLYVVIAIAILFVNRFLCFAARYTLHPVLASMGKFQSNRTKGLILVAGALFLIATFSRLLNITGIGEQGDVIFLVIRVLVSVAGVAIAWSVVLLWFPRSWVATGRPIQKVLTLLIVIVGAAIWIEGNFYAYDIAVMSLAAIAFVCTVIGIGGCKSAKVEAEEPVDIETPVFRPSIFSLVPVLVLGLALSLPWFIDTSVLAMSNKRSYGFANVRNSLTVPELFELARKSASAKWKSDGRITFVYDPNNAISVWKVQFEKSAPKDLLSALPDVGRNGVELSGLTPDFDLDSLQGKAAWLILNDCRVSRTQLNSLLDQVTGLEIKGAFSIVDDGAPVDPGTITSIVFRETEGGTAKAFFDATQCESQLTFMVYQSPVSNEDWPSIQKIAQNTPAYLQGGWAADFVLPEENLPLSRMVMYEPEGKLSKKEFRKQLMLQTDISLHLPHVDELEGALHWKLWVLRGSMGNMWFHDLFQQSGKSIDVFTKELGMAYEVNDESIRSLYFPNASSLTEIEALDELRVLSFDPDWVRPAANAFGATGGLPVNVDHLKSLTSLEELYFDSLFAPEDLSILANLNSLKHLQIPSVVRSVTGPIGFDVCQSLESITFLGTPDNQTWREVSRLKKLKLLTIVNVEDDDSLTEELVAKAKKKLPGVEVRIFKPNETESLIPKKFREYRDGLREELRSDTKWLDEVLE